MTMPKFDGPGELEEARARPKRPAGIGVEPMER